MKEIKLTQNKIALVDDDIYSSLITWKWTYSGGYAYRRKCIKGISRKIWLHRVCNETSDGLYTDHINGNKLDNRKANLRNCTYSENNKNAPIRKDNNSGYRGVYWFDKIKSNNWRAVINVNGRRISLGFFNCPKRAAQAYNLAAIKYHKQFAKLNQIQFNLKELNKIRQV